MAKPKKSADKAVVAEVVEKVSGADKAAPAAKYVFTRDIKLYISIKPNVKQSFKKGDEIVEQHLINRLLGILPSPIKKMG